MSSQSGLTRRELLRGMSAGTVSVGVASLMGGCSLGTFGESSNTTGGKRSTTVRFGMSGAATSADLADPALSNTQHDGRLMTAVYEQLTRFDESLKGVPWLAESWDANRDSSKWTFRLRRGVRFHNGDRLTAHDVVHSFRRVLDPATGSPEAALLAFLSPDDITPIDDQTLAFGLREPVGDLPTSLITKNSYIVPDGSTSDDLRRAAVGTGAFRLREFTPGADQTVFAKNPAYWQPGLPRSDVFELLPIPETATRVAALERGQVHIIENVPATDFERIRSGGGRIQAQAKGDMECMAVQIDAPPFDDPRVREALKYALDRRGMMSLVAQNQATMLNDIPISSRLQYGLDDPVRAHDVAKARALMTEAGQDKDLTIRLATSDVQARFMDFATAYKAMAAEAGIDVQLQVSPADSYWEEVWLQVPAFITAWIARPTETMLAMLFTSGSSSNETHWNRPDWEQRFRKARASQSTAEREALFSELQREVVAEGGYLTPYMAKTVSATTDRVNGWRPSGTYFEDFAGISVRA